MAYTVLEKNKRSSDEKPIVTFGATGVVYLNKYIMENYFKGFEWVLLLYDKDNQKLALKPVKNEQDETFRLNFSSQKSKSTGVVAARSVIKLAKIDYSKTRHYEAKWDPKEHLLEIQLNKGEIKP